jgi:hypothetical protein
MVAYSNNHGLWYQVLGVFLMMISYPLTDLFETYLLDVLAYFKKRKKKKNFSKYSPQAYIGNIFERSYPEFIDDLYFREKIFSIDEDHNIFFKIIYFPFKVLFLILLIPLVATGIYFALSGIIWCIRIIFYKLKKSAISNKKFYFYLISKEFIKFKKGNETNLPSFLSNDKTMFIKLRIKDLYLNPDYIMDPYKTIESYTSYEVNGIPIKGSDYFHRFENWILGNGKIILDEEIYLLPSGTKLYPKIVDLTHLIHELNPNTYNPILPYYQPNYSNPVPANQRLKTLDQPIFQPINQKDNKPDLLYIQFRELVNSIFSKELNKIVIDCSKYPNYLEDSIQKAVELKRIGSFNESIKIYLEIIRNENKVFPEVLTFLYKSVLCTCQLDFAYETILLAEDFIKRCRGANSIEVAYYEEKRFEFEEILKKLKQETLPSTLVINPALMSSENFLKNIGEYWLNSHLNRLKLLKNFIAPYSGGAKIMVSLQNKIIDEFLINCNDISLLYKHRVLF